jgi:hypothetical protein
MQVQLVHVSKRNVVPVGYTFSPKRHTVRGIYLVLLPLHRGQHSPFSRYVADAGHANTGQAFLLHCMEPLEHRHLTQGSPGSVASSPSLNSFPLRVQLSHEGQQFPGLVGGVGWVHEV